jgi:predicted XRE-type DNA-binding protein
LEYKRSISAAHRAEVVRESPEKSGKVLHLPPVWKRAAAKFQWRERADAYDDHERAEWEKKRRALIDEALERHLQQARLMQKKALEKLAATPGTDLRMKDAARMLFDGMKQEMIAVGAPAEIRETHVQQTGVLRVEQPIAELLKRDPATLTDEELRRLDEW